MGKSISKVFRLSPGNSSVRVVATDFITHPSAPTSPSVTTQIVDTNDVTNVANGLVERDGLLWVEDLPLSDGANTLTLTMTDAANIVSVTNLNLVKSDLLLTMDPITGDLWQPTVTVSGTVSDTSYAVWVNGIHADVNPSTGTWTASRYYTFGQPGMSKHVLTISANGYLLAPDRVRPLANYWVGQKINFSSVVVPALPTEYFPPDETVYPVKTSTWTLPNKFVNKAVVYGNPDNNCTTYVIDYDELLQNDTSAWWVTEGEKRIGCNVRYFAGPQTYARVS